EFSLEELILRILNQEGFNPPTAEELGITLGAGLEELAAALARLEREGRIVKGKKGRYYLPRALGMMRGRIQGSGKGFAFFIPETEEGGDFFLAPAHQGGALHKDMVLARELLQKKPRGRRDKRLPRLGESRRRECEVIRVIERANERLVGTYRNMDGHGLVTPDDRRIGVQFLVRKKDSLSARSGDKVVLHVDVWNEFPQQSQGRVLEIFGSQGDPLLDIVSVAKKHRLETEFPEHVSALARAVAKIVPKDLAGREDWREELLVTIDGADAKDLDDAVSLKTNAAGNWLLGVHIADVAHYVKAGSALDKEAWHRGTSVYLPGLVIPMLPKELSNGICSLNANEDRLALSCVMEIAPDGQPLSHYIAETVIKVGRRLTYELVNAALERQEEQALEELREYLPLLQSLRSLRQVLRRARQERGAIDFDFPETKVLLDENGKAAEIVKRVQGTGESIIEEMMIRANETVAAEFSAKGAPFLYRVHQAFSADKLAELNELLARWDYHIRGAEGKTRSKDVQTVLAKAKGTPQERIVATLLLRSMSHARYSHEALGHFALASKFYSHFTSPIRRYPDLAIHRVIKAYLARGFMKEDEAERLRLVMAQTAAQSSRAEREAEEAEREAVAVKCCEYMTEHLGEEFSGHISGVTGYGFYVELENTVEGLVPVSSLGDDFYEYDENELALRGRRRKKIYRLGDAVTVKISDVDKANRTITMRLSDLQSS
ncbi:MAG: ribonuclease R, partial [Clostridiales bacterium]|nr:ribonuclease R [Clostridiales bacterium]